MARKLPPLHLIYIFDAAARHLSFKKAGEELFLTPSAISHQVKALEEHLDLKLFRRLSRGVELSDAGRDYLRTVDDVLQRLDRGTHALVNRYGSPALRISTFPTLAMNIIIPRLDMFQQAHPEIELRIETGLNLVDLNYDDFDLGLRLGDGKWSNVHSEKLFDIKVTPVCSPKFAEKYQLTDISQINDVPLINLPSMGDVWQTWRTAMNLPHSQPKAQLSFGNYDAALIAAQEGLGLALGSFPLDNTLVRRGALVRPFKEVMPFQQSVYAVCRPEDKDRHHIQCFINWLMRSPDLT